MFSCLPKNIPSFYRNGYIRCPTTIQFLLEVGQSLHDGKSSSNMLDSDNQPLDRLLSRFVDMVRSIHIWCKTLNPFSSPAPKTTSFPLWKHSHYHVLLRGLHIMFFCYCWAGWIWDRMGTTPGIFNRMSCNFCQCRWSEGLYLKQACHSVEYVLISF